MPVTYIISYINYTCIEKTSYFSLPLPRLLSEVADTLCGVRCCGTSMFYNLFSNVHEIRDAFPISIGCRRRSNPAWNFGKVFSIFRRVNPSLKTSASFLKRWPFSSGNVCFYRDANGISNTEGSRFDLLNILLATERRLSEI